MEPVFRLRVEEVLRRFPGVSVVAGYRSPEFQDRLAAEKPGMALPAGRSRHPRGLAVDLSAPRSQLDAIAASGLLRRPRSDEPWHFE